MKEGHLCSSIKQVGIINIYHYKSHYKNEMRCCESILHNLKCYIHIFLYIDPYMHSSPLIILKRVSPLFYKFA